MAFGYMMFLFMILFTVCCSSVWTRDAVGVCIWFKFKKEIWFWEIWEISLTGRILFFHGGLKWCVCPWTFTKLHSLLWLFFFTAHKTRRQTNMLGNVGSDAATVGIIWDQTTTAVVQVVRNNGTWCCSVFTSCNNRLAAITAAQSPRTTRTPT